MTDSTAAPLIVTASSPHVLSKGALADLKAAVQAQLPPGSIVVVADRGVTLTAAFASKVAA